MKPKAYKSAQSTIDFLTTNPLEHVYYYTMTGENGIRLAYQKATKSQIIYNLKDKLEEEDYFDAIWLQDACHTTPHTVYSVQDRTFMNWLKQYPKPTPTGITGPFYMTEIDVDALNFE